MGGELGYHGMYWYCAQVHCAARFSGQARPLTHQALCLAPLSCHRFQMAADECKDQLQPGHEQRQQKRARVTDAAVRAVALEQQVPRYAVSGHWAVVLGGAAGCLIRPFSSLLLAPAVQLEPPTMAHVVAKSGLRAALRWQLLPGGTAVSGRALPTLLQTSWQTVQQGPAAAEHGAGPCGKVGGSSPDKQQQHWQQQYEQLLAQDEQDEQLWLGYAVRHAVEGAQDRATSGSVGGVLLPGAR